MGKLGSTNAVLCYTVVKFILDRECQEVIMLEPLVVNFMYCEKGQSNVLQLMAFGVYRYYSNNVPEIIIIMILLVLRFHEFMCALVSFPDHVRIKGWKEATKEGRVERGSECAIFASCI